MPAEIDEGDPKVNAMKLKASHIFSETSAYGLITFPGLYNLVLFLPGLAPAGVCFRKILKRLGQGFWYSH